MRCAADDDLRVNSPSIRRDKLLLAVPLPVLDAGEAGKPGNKEATSGGVRAVTLLVLVFLLLLVPVFRELPLLLLPLRRPPVAATDPTR